MSSSVNKLNPVKRKIISSLLINNYDVMALVFARVYTSGINGSKTWLYSGLEGGLALVIDYHRRAGRFILFDLETFEIIFENELYKKFNIFYSETSATFQCFEIPLGFIGFCIPNVIESKAFYRTVCNLTDNAITKRLKEHRLVSLGDVKSAYRKNISILKKKLAAEYFFKETSMEFDGVNFDYQGLNKLLSLIDYDEDSRTFLVSGSSDEIDELASKVSNVKYMEKGGLRINDVKAYAFELYKNIRNSMARDKENEVIRKKEIEKKNMEKKKEEEDRIKALAKSQKVQKVTKVPAVPNISKVPAVPNTSKVPGVPNVPKVPAVPNVPKVPAVPNVPKVPAVPNVPKVPAVPNVSKVPVTPKTQVGDPKPIYAIDNQLNVNKVQKSQPVDLMEEIRLKANRNLLKKVPENTCTNVDNLSINPSAKIIASDDIAEKDVVKLKPQLPKMDMMTELRMKLNNKANKTEKFDFGNIKSRQETKPLHENTVIKPNTTSFKNETTTELKPPVFESIKVSTTGGDEQNVTTNKSNISYDLPVKPIAITEEKRDEVTKALFGNNIVKIPEGENKQSIYRFLYR
jgi:hypothetical protein